MNRENVPVSGRKKAREKANCVKIPPMDQNLNYSTASNYLHVFHSTP